MQVLKSWTWWWIAVAAIIGIAFGWVGVAVQCAITTGVVAYTVGAVIERRRIEKRLMRQELEAFTAFAERMLTLAPDDLDDDMAVLRDRLQSDYQRAQQMLRDLR